ncbi:helix-turn-helix domain-containing protein [Actinomadura barringtoniae]|uniref:Helix-turn-helix domain-containing protein n=2 Tax=Actinomadura barringtoniae TaxID=1427535 RepID=A0A939PP10_9ACTN|nr:helix-turn-helix domain-containing protein [Actinomadura barringtoniae]
MDRQQLADFLRRSRERLRPGDVGLASGPRRRTPGLRREEVSQLAGMSADYYMRLEQARSPQPSTQMLGALARALRLTEDERDHLYLLAGHRPPAGRFAGNHIRPGLLYLLDRLEETPAQILSDLGDLLAQNALAEALLGCVCTVREEDRNIVLRWFTQPFIREAFPPEERDQISRMHVADLRAAVARRNHDAASTELVERIRAASDEFAKLWDLHEVAVRRKSRMRVQHPSLGPVELECESLLTPAEDQRLLVFTPPPGTDAIDYLGLLRVVGPEITHRHHAHQ